MGNATMVEQIAATRALTSKPFGVDLLTAMPGSMIEQTELIIEGGAKMFVAGLGVPAEVIDLCHNHGVLVGSMCGKVDHARRAVDAGVDVVIVQGTEAGGHTGMVATMPLVPMVVDVVAGRVPVVAAGGIFDGRGLAAALALGADGVWMGTRFIGTPEARGLPHYKERLLATGEDSTVISRAFSGKTMRVIKNETTAHFEAHPEELKPFPEQLMASFANQTFHLGGGEDALGVDPNREGYPAGQAVGAIDQLVGAAELVRRFMDEAEATLARTSTLAGR
jgi:enoyl-[acyl-carrier protein] reductase II